MSNDRNDFAPTSSESDDDEAPHNNSQSDQLDSRAAAAVVSVSKRGVRNYGSIHEGQQEDGEKSLSSSSHPRTASKQNDSANGERTPLTSSSPSGSSTPEDMRSTLSFLRKLGFGLGHVYNDLCATIWFSYTLLFMQQVLGLAHTESGNLIMLGQVCDAIATPIVGVLADRYGTKRSWHIAGTVMVSLSFPMIFAICPWCSTTPYAWWPPLYFAIFVIIFQVAWAIVQISHFAMIPELSKTTKDRADLSATRYSASVIANIVVYVTMWIVLNGRNLDTNNIGAEDAARFRDVALIVTIVGLYMSVLFHISLARSDYENRRLMSLAATRSVSTTPSSSSSGRRSKDSTENGQSATAAVIVDYERSSSMDTDRLIREEEVQPTDAYSSINTLGSDRDANVVERRRDLLRFMKSPVVYQNVLLYVFARLFMTTSLLYMPLWLNERTYKVTIVDTDSSVQPPASPIEHLATVPLVSFLASFVSSMILKFANRKIPYGMAYLLGSGISLAACAQTAFATPASGQTLQLFVLAILFGSGSSVTMVSSLCITADMIGQHTYQGGFIYSAVTFADKLITGIVVAIIEREKCDNRINCPNYYKYVLSYGCGLAAILGALTLATLRISGRCRRRRRRISSRSHSAI